jgi:hypothetical protein
VLHSLRKRAATAEPGRLFYAEWSAPEGSDPDDVAAWYQANPSLGIHISEDFVRDERRALSHSPGEFVRERLGVPDPLPEDTSAKPVKLPADKWAATLGRFGPSGRVTIAFDVSRDHEWSSIAVASGSLQAPYVEVIEHRKHSGWLPARLVELVRKHDPLAVACNGSGAAGALVGPVGLAFSEAKLGVELEQLGAVEYKQACGGFFADVVEGRLCRNAALLQGPLDNAAGDAAERPLGDAWAWDVRNTTVPLSPLVAVTVARALLPVEVEKRSAYTEERGMRVLG